VFAEGGLANWQRLEGRGNAIVMALPPTGMTPSSRDRQRSRLLTFHCGLRPREAPPPSRHKGEIVAENVARYDTTAFLFV
jgi:hypothetical protein